ncbi:MAG: hypothetical protein HQK50_07330 [Oligoflexia bacterium]|nr:hypothetical protein [Oligoflexia bacterium]
MSVKISTLSLTCFQLLVVLSALHAEDPTLWTGRVSSGIGHSSTYLPLNKGYLIHDRYKQDVTALIPPDLNPGLIVTDTSEKNLLQRFEEARADVLKRGAEESLYGFFADYDYEKGEAEWRGMCHQWSAAACDPKVKKEISLDPTVNLKQKKSILCGKNIISTNEIRELFTATYPSKNSLFLGSARNAPNEYYNQAFFHKKHMDVILAHGGMVAFKELNDSDYAVMDSLGMITLKEGPTSPVKWTLPAHQFHNTTKEQLSSNAGIVLNIDPGEEIWNQPVFEMESSAVEVLHQGKEMPYLRYDADDAATSNHFFYLASNELQKTKLDLLDEIDAVLKILIEKRNKTPDEKISEIIREKNLLLSPTLESFITNLENKREQFALAKEINKLLAFKAASFEEAKQAGIQLKDQFTAHHYTTTVRFMDENDNFRSGGDRIGKNSYTYYVIKNKQNGFVYSNWSGPHLAAHRPGFIWVPIPQADSCHLVAASENETLKRVVKNQEYLLQSGPSIDEAKEADRLASVRDVCLNTGLSDLLNLCSSCPTTDEALQSVHDLLAAIEKVSLTLQLKNSDTQKDLRGKLSAIKDKNILISRSEFNKELQAKKIPLSLNEKSELVFPSN